jgi:leader peptidase (prepilin peptidase)/N-methyltransferase
MTTDPTTAVLAAVTGVLGLVFGGLANVAITTWQPGRGAATPASRRPGSGRKGGRRLLPHAGGAGRWQDRVVPLLVGVVWALIAVVHGPAWVLPALLLVAWAVVVATVIDLEHRIIPNRLTYRLAPLVLVLLVGAAAVTGSWGDLRRAVLVGLVLPLAMFLLSELFRVLRGQAGMGMGDVKLAVSLGLALGYLGGWQVAVGLYATVLAAVVVAFGLVAVGRARLATRIPFGPYLAAGTLVAFLVGDPLARVVQRWLGLT